MPDVRGLSKLAHELAEAGQYEKALELVNKEIKTDANNANAWYNKGILLFLNVQIPGRSQFIRLRQRTSTRNSREAWYNKGVALMTLEKYLEATRAFDKAIAINPNDRHRHDSSGIWHRKKLWRLVVSLLRLQGNKLNCSSNRTKFTVI